MHTSELNKALFRACDKLNIPVKPEDIVIEVPANVQHGDFATNICMRAAKLAKKAPPKIAEEMQEVLNKDSVFAKCYEVSSIGGFLNFKIKNSYLIELLISGKCLPVQQKDNKKVLLEFVSANPTGPLHIGHGRWAALGDILARVMRFSGKKVDTEFYINDAGNQIEKFKASVDAIKNNKPVPEDGYHGAYVKQLAASNEDPLKTILEQQKDTLASMDVSFANWFSEKTLHDKGKVVKAYEKLQEIGAAEKKDGALWFLSTKYGDDKDRVIVRESGEPTYLAADIAYHEDKIARGYDQLINIWGADHHGYIARVKAALWALHGKEAADKLTILLGQLVNLFRNGEPVRVKRTGEMITLQEVIEEIGPDATRFFLVSKSPDTMLDFDLEVAKKKNDENPVYYIQYAHARICSILRQDGAKISEEIKKQDLEPMERELIVRLVRMSEDILSIAETCAVYKLTHFAEELAALFHRFYHQYRVISDDPIETTWRLLIVQRVKETLAVIFGLLGISAPEKM